jgi:hypothetical protein
MAVLGRAGTAADAQLSSARSAIDSLLAGGAAVTTSGRSELGSPVGQTSSSTSGAPSTATSSLTGLLQEILGNHG